MSDVFLWVLKCSMRCRAACFQHRPECELVLAIENENVDFQATALNALRCNMLDSGVSCKPVHLG